MLKKHGFVKNHIIILLLVLILGSVLRFHALDYQSLWNDELATWMRSNFDDIITVINFNARTDFHPPGYHILIYFVEKKIGITETILRLPSAIAGVLSILFIYLLGKRLYSSQEGLIASALMAVSWCPIYYSQEARAYSILLTLSILSTYLLISMLLTLQRKNKISYVLILTYIIIAIITCYIHYYGLYLIALQGLFAILVFFRKRKEFSLFLLIYLAIFLAYLPWLPIMWEHLHKELTWIQPPKITAFLYYLGFLFNRSKLILLIVLIFYLLLFIREMSGLWREKQFHNIKINFLNPSMILFLWLFIPFSLVYLSSLISTPVLTNRNLIISLPAAYLLLSRSITQLPIHKFYQHMVALVLVCLILFHLIFYMRYYEKPVKAQFREAVAFIVERERLYKDSLILGYAWHHKYLDYYFQKHGSSKRVKSIVGDSKDISEARDIISQEQPKYVWYVYAFRKPHKAFLESLNKSLTLIEHKRFFEAGVWLFKNDT
jgi:uncharacterized membrane protein